MLSILVLLHSHFWGSSLPKQKPSQELAEHTGVGSLLQGRSQPLWAWPENWMLPSFPRASFPLQYSILSSWYLAPGSLTKSLLKIEKSSPIQKVHTCGLILVALTLPFLGSKAQLIICGPVWQWGSCTLERVGQQLFLQSSVLNPRNEMLLCLHYDQKNPNPSAYI